MLSAFAGGKLFGERAGEGRPVVLALHGWRCDHTRMHPVVAGFDAISLDLPGFGKSPAPDAIWGAEEYAKAVGEVFEQFDQPPVVVGHSFGGRVAVNLAALYPDRVKALVIVGSPLIRKTGTAKKPSLGFRAMKLGNRLGVVSDERMEAERRKRGSADYRAATGIMRDVFVKLVNESYESQLGAVKCPTELVWGEHDTEAPLRNAHDAQGYLGQSALTVVAGGDHYSVIEQPIEVQAAIRRCLA